jgi:predicted enzyme related to lactoylglutathione lyase
MLEDTKAFCSFTTNDVSKVQDFYSQSLGLKVSEDRGALWLDIGGGQRVLVYMRPGHTPASFTILNFPVEDIDRAVDGLTERGVHFERYAEFNADEKRIVRGEDRSIAWFKDPAGNVHSLVQET